MTLVRPEEREAKEAESGPNTAIKLKTPKRILHFSDGILEEYSDDEVDNTPDEQAMVDPSTLTWGPWIWFKAWRAGTGTLSVIDTVGEYLASFFGITTPKYYFELEEYRKKQEEIKKEGEAKAGWSEPSAAAVTENLTLNNITTQQPQPV